MPTAYGSGGEPSCVSWQANVPPQVRFVGARAGRSRLRYPPPNGTERAWSGCAMSNVLQTATGSPAFVPQEQATVELRMRQTEAPWSEGGERQTIQGVRQAPSPPPWRRSPVLGPAPPMDAAAARRYCAALATRHYENFPVVTAPFSRTQREALAAIYAFARIADDFADEPAFEGLREQFLDGWENELQRCFAGEADHPVFVALREAIARFGYGPEPFLALLSAFRQDSREHRYATFGELLDYCGRSANPVGRLVLHTLGIRDARSLEWSDRLCTALQLTNFWQDLSVDLPRGRLYLPLEDLARFDVPVEAVLARRVVPGLAELLRLELDRTAALFADSLPLVVRAGWPGGVYLAGVWLGGRTVLAMTRTLGTDVLYRRPTLDVRQCLQLGATLLERRRS